MPAWTPERRAKQSAMMLERHAKAKGVQPVEHVRADAEQVPAVEDAQPAEPEGFYGFFGGVDFFGRIRPKRTF